MAAELKLLLEEFMEYNKHETRHNLETEIIKLGWNIKGNQYISPCKSISTKHLFKVCLQLLEELKVADDSTQGNGMLLLKGFTCENREEGVEAEADAEAEADENTEEGVEESEADADLRLEKVKVPPKKRQIELPIEPKNWPGAMEEWIRAKKGKLKLKPKEHKALSSKAKQHLRFMKWTIMKVCKEKETKKGKAKVECWEERYITPAPRRKRRYGSLLLACEEAVKDNEGQNVQQHQLEQQEQQEQQVQQVQQHQLEQQEQHEQQEQQVQQHQLEQQEQQEQQVQPRKRSKQQARKSVKALDDAN